MFVPLVSEAALVTIREPADDKVDNVLLEYEHAVLLHTTKRLAVLPILIGQRDANV